MAPSGEYWDWWGEVLMSNLDAALRQAQDDKTTETPSVLTEVCTEVAEQN